MGASEGGPSCFFGLCCERWVEDGWSGCLNLAGRVSRADDAVALGRLLLVGCVAQWSGALLLGVLPGEGEVILE
jgi:hypothetical protein